MLVLTVLISPRDYKKVSLFNFLYFSERVFTYVGFVLYHVIGKRKSIRVLYL